jgi:intein/homing endonuclease
MQFIDGKPDLAPKQLALVNLCRQKNGLKKIILMSGSRKSGKCLTPDTLVYTSEGIMPISMLGSAETGKFSQCQKEVACFDTETNRIIKSNTDLFYNSGKIAGFTIQTDRGYEISCSEEHPVWCEVNGDIGYKKSSEINQLIKSGKSVWIPILKENTLWPTEYKSIKYEYFYGNDRNQAAVSQRIEDAITGGAVTNEEISRVSKTSLTSVAKYKYSPFYPNILNVVVDNDLAYLIGLIIGDGGYSKSVVNASRCGFSSNDQELIESLSEILAIKFPDSLVKHTGGAKCDYRIESASFLEFLKVTRMAGKYSYEKEIPEFIFGSPKTVVIGLLQGLFDTDGTVGKKGNVSYCSTSRKLAFGVQNLLMSLGVRSTMYFKKNAFKGAWILSCFREDEFCNKIGFRLKRKQDRANKERKNLIEQSCYPPSLVDVIKEFYLTRKSRGVGELSRKFHRTTKYGVFSRNFSLSRKRVEPLIDILKCSNESSIQKYICGWGVWWDRAERAVPIIEEMVDVSVPKYRNFISNGFISHNTISGMVAIADHLWNIKKASVLVLCKTQGSGATSGVWNELTETVIPAFIAADFGMEWAPKGSPAPWKNGGEPRIHGATKKMMCAVVNKHGGISELEMDSLDDEREIDDKYKSRYQSMIYWSEAAEFYERKSFDTLLLALRGFDLPDEDCVFLIDCNPALTGESHFLYNLFYELRISTEADDDEKVFQKCLHLTEWTMDDNPFISENEKAIIRAAYKHSPALRSRMVDGKWIKIVEKGLFTVQFSRALHIVGEPDEKDPEILIPMEGCTELITSHDAGGVNPVSYILEKCIIHDEKKDTSVFRYLDELAFIGEPISVEEFTVLFLKKMDFWEKEVGNEIRWSHWADRSALDVKESIANRTVADEMFSVSGGRIKLVGVDKGRGSVGNRIRLWRKLLIQGRIVISGSKCPKLLEMNENINCGKIPDSVSTHSVYKHPFDSCTYAVAKECWDELCDNVMTIRTSSRPKAGTGLVSIRM